MKKIILAIAVLNISLQCIAQNKAMPTTSIRDLKGKKIAFNKAFEPGKVTLVSFWATWCEPCEKEITAINKNLPDWKKEVDFNFATVSTDDARATGKVKTYATTQGWEFPVFLDPNDDLKRSLNYSNVPFTIIIDKEGKIAYMHSGYLPGGEIELFEKVKELAKK